MQNLKLQFKIKNLLSLFLIYYSLFLLLTSPILAFDCGIGPFEGGVCCPLARCSGGNYGLLNCGQGESCCETCIGDIGSMFKLGGRSIKSIFPTLGSFISAILPNVYMIAGVILFVLLIFGGFTYIVSAGKAKPEGVQQGRNAISVALIGFLLIFLSWWIIQIIEIITGIKIFEPEFPS